MHAGSLAYTYERTYARMHTHTHTHTHTRMEKVKLQTSFSNAACNPVLDIPRDCILRNISTLIREPPTPPAWNRTLCSTTLGRRPSTMLSAGTMFAFSPMVRLAVASLTAWWGPRRIGASFRGSPWPSLSTSSGRRCVFCAIFGALRKAFDLRRRSSYLPRSNHVHVTFVPCSG
jgi:hypothetical protein